MPFEVDFYVNDFARQVDEKFALVVGNDNKVLYQPDTIDKDIETWMALFDINKRMAESSFVPELQYDVVYGDDKWSAKERFLKQKMHLDGALMALSAIESSRSAVNCLDEKLKQLKQPVAYQKEYYTPLFNEYVSTKAKEVASEEMKDEIEKYNFKGFGKKLPFFVVGMSLILIGAFALFMVGIVALASVEYIKEFGYSLIDTIVAIVAASLLLLGLIISIPAFKVQSEKRAVQNKLHNLEYSTKVKLKKELLPVLKEYNQNYYQLMLDADASSKEQIIQDFKKKRADMYYAYQDAKKFFKEHYAFAENFDWDTLQDICQAMRNGIADSYSSALRYVLDEQKKAAQRAEDLAIKKEEMRLQAEHNKRMEEMSQEQMLAAQRQANAAEATAYYSRRAAIAAEIQKDYAREQASAARDAANEAKKTNDILRGW